MKFNWKLLTCILVLVVVLTVGAGLAFGLTADSRRIGDILNNMKDNDFDWIDTVVKQDDLVVYSSIKGEITNPMELDIDYQQSVSQFNWDVTFDIMHIQKTDITYFYEVKIKDSKYFCGNYINDIKVNIQINRANKKVDKLVILYQDRGFDISITAYKEVL